MNLKLITIFVAFFITTNLNGQVLIRKVKPSSTDPLITTFNTDSNYVYLNTNVISRNILVVHLPGSFGEPKRATIFGTLAANLGFHSIGLMYPNVPTVGSFCTNSSDPDCFENVRREIVEGVNHSSSLTIPANESILNRTQKLVQYLHSNFPTENWGQYLDANNNLIFNKIIFSGHSQGGGHAAIIAKFYPIKRAICFSSPKDWRNATDAPPLWLSEGNWQTPKSEIYCFNHVLDEHVNHQLEIWDSLGLNSYGAPVNVDNTSSPYNHTRQLTTAYNVPTDDAHACTIQDNKTPKISNVPVFASVWTYMLLDNLSTSVPRSETKNSAYLYIYPNPATQMINIRLPEASYRVKIYEPTGKVIYEYQATSENTKIDISSLKSGVYYIQAGGNKNQFSGKLLKQ